MDIEDALGIEHAMSDELAVDALRYASEFFLPAMSRVTGSDPRTLDVVAVRDGQTTAATTVRAFGSTSPAAATITGAPLDLLLALWGRDHGPVSVTGDQEIVAQWSELPGTAFQFGTWD